MYFHPNHAGNLPPFEIVCGGDKTECFKNACAEVSSKAQKNPFYQRTFFLQNKNSQKASNDNGFQAIISRKNRDLFLTKNTT